MRFLAAVQVMLAILFAAAPVLGAEGDKPGSSDYPLIGRFENSVITYYDVKDFDEHTIFTGPVAKKGNLENARKVEGKMYRIAYKASKQHSLTEIFRNFEMGMQESGFEILFSCESKECKETNFSREVEKLPMPKMVVDSWNYRYLSARLTRAEGDVYASFLLSVSGNGDRTFQLMVVELEAMKYRMVGADEMAKDIAMGGHVALYGIFFDTNSADLKSESKPTLDEIGKLMNKDRSLKLIIVGHTDNEGSLDHNLDLSRRRAAAVVSQLVGQHGISQARLTASGAAFLAPVATNDSEEGRAKNRRVELVKQ